MPVAHVAKMLDLGLGVEEHVNRRVSQWRVSCKVKAQKINKIFALPRLERKEAGKATHPTDT